VSESFQIDLSNADANRKMTLKDVSIVAGLEIAADRAMVFCLSQGISVHNEVAIAGLGDLRLSAMPRVPLTTIGMKAHLIGEPAALLVLNRFKSYPAKEHVIDVGYEIMMRQSA